MVSDDWCQIIWFLKISSVKFSLNIVILENLVSVKLFLRIRSQILVSKNLTRQSMVSDNLLLEDLQSENLLSEILVTKNLVKTYCLRTFRFKFFLINNYQLLTTNFPDIGCLIFLIFNLVEFLCILFNTHTHTHTNTHTYKNIHTYIHTMIVVHQSSISYKYLTVKYLFVWVLWHINTCRLFYAKSTFIQIKKSISNHSV